VAVKSQVLNEDGIQVAFLSLKIKF